MGPTIQALNLLITIVFDLYIMVVAVRFLMQATRANYHNPLAQAVVKLTNPVLVPLRRFIPGFQGHDIAALVLCLLLIALKMFVFKLLALGSISIAGQQIYAAALTPLLIAALSPIDLINLFFNVFIYSLVILAILSWVAPGGNNPAGEVLSDITRPVIAPIRARVKPIAGMDFSVLIAIVALQVLKIIIVGNLVALVAR